MKSCKCFHHLFLLENSTFCICQQIEPYIEDQLLGGGFPLDELTNRNEKENSEDTDTSAQRGALLKGGDQVISVLQEMITLLEDMDMDEDSEKVAVELAAQGVIGKRVDQMESDFMMALDYMIF
ncbi:protein PEP-RELATED DEVELOPMENT ARRESTED 1, chloroplastic-like [Vicia villosa]|uniref:protein PEP-RELATED DEVELOPMENT ARRESTED 1, chloroplastic-like n=1 Tax=Vicia villosa TaxID=3911 RepID=UPI00273B3F27|nr:protein PEP-RELATED DEVELOPMENT ARRESTED 1, chloroplastic-like [Vicia villosa]